MLHYIWIIIQNISLLGSVHFIRVLKYDRSEGRILAKLCLKEKKKNLNKTRNSNDRRYHLQRNGFSWQGLKYLREKKRWRRRRISGQNNFEMQQIRYKMIRGASHKIDFINFVNIIITITSSCTPKRSRDLPGLDVSNSCISASLSASPISSKYLKQ